MSNFLRVCWLVCWSCVLAASYANFVFITNIYQRLFACPVNDCRSSFKRKDHMTRHLLQHQGKHFTCPVENCKSRFAYHASMKKHVTKFHKEDEGRSPSDAKDQKQHICQEEGCGKMFDYASRLRKHEESHVKLDFVEVYCGEPGCMKAFTNAECLKTHYLSCHQYLSCEICGTQQLKKNIKRHMRTHEPVVFTAKIKCTFEGCLHSFATRSNLNQHIKAVHLEDRPFACRVAGCDKRFPYRHVRDNHEKSSPHVYVDGDFEESDELFLSRPRGGRKRKYPTIEMLQRKRVVPPSYTDVV